GAGESRSTARTPAPLRVHRAGTDPPRWCGAAGNLDSRTDQSPDRSPTRPGDGDGAPDLLPWRCHGRNSPEEERTLMRRYEIMVILEPGLDERTVAPSLEDFLGVVRNDGGSVEKVDIWGKRRLAYDIDKNSEGIYAVVDLTAKTETVKELERQFGIAESVLRTKVLRPEIH